jgi:hypothetical protein
MAALQAFYGITVTLSDANPHQLLPLLVAIDSTLSNLLQNVGSLQIQADSGNGANYVLVGDANVATSRMAYKLAAGASRPYQKEAMSIPLGAVYLRASAATCLVNVEIIP